MGKRNNGKLRRRLWERDPHCYYCGAVTEWRELDGGKRPTPNMATLEHLRMRIDKNRTEPSHGERRIVLACRKCNNKEGNRRYNSLPRRELWERSGGYPLGHPKARDYKAPLM